MGWQDDEVISAGSQAVPGTAAKRAAWEADEIIGGRSNTAPEGLTINMSRRSGASEGGVSRETPGKEVSDVLRPAVGFNRTVADIAGAPVDATNAALRQAGSEGSPTTAVLNSMLSPAAQDLRKRAYAETAMDSPIGGSGTVKKAMGALPFGGANPDDVRPAETPGEKILEGAGSGAAAMLVPGLGAEALLARSLKETETFGTMALNLLKGTGAASNTAIGAAGGALGEAGAETVPDDASLSVGPVSFSAPALKEAARLGGNLAGGGLAAGVVSGVEAGGRAAGAAIRGATEAPELQAARTILKRADDPAALRQAATDAAEAPALVPKSEPTLFQATGDLGVGGLEREVAASQKGVPRFAAVREEQNSARLAELENLQKALPENADPGAVSDLVRNRAQAIEQTGAESVGRARQATLDEIERLRAEGDPGAVTNFVRQQVDDLTKTFDQRVTAARAKLDESFRAGQLNEAEYGAALRETPVRLRNELEAIEDDLWRAIDPDKVVPFNPTDLKSGFSKIEKDIPRTAKGPAEEEASLLDVVLGPKDRETGIRNGGLDELTTFGEITALRSRLTDALRDRTLTPTVNRRVTLMLKEVDKALENTGLAVPGMSNAEGAIGSVLDRYAAARTATRDVKTRFGEGSLGAVLKEGDRDGFRMTASNVAKNIFDRPEDLRAYLAAVGDDAAARASLQDYAAFSLRKAAVRDGMLSPENYQKWMANHEYVLKEFPELRQQFGNMRSAQTAMDGTLAAQKGTLAEYQTGALGKILENQDPTKAIGRTLNDPAEFSAVIDRVRDDPEAFAGLKRAVTDYMLSRSMGTAGGTPQTNVASLEKFYLQNKGPLDQLFGDDLAKRLANVRNAQTTLEDALNVQKEALNSYQTGAIKRLLNTQDPDQVITNALKRPGEFEALAKETASDPAAAAGMKRAVVDYMLKQARSTAEAGTSGEAQINAATLQKFFLNNKRSLSALFSPEEMASMERVTMDLQRANRSNVAVKIPGPGTAQDLPGSLKSVLGHLMRHFGATAGAGTGSMFGPGGMVAGAAAGAVADALRVARVNSIESALVEMMLDPKMAAEWLRKVPATDGAATASSFARRLKALTAAQITEAMDNESKRQ